MNLTQKQLAEARKEGWTVSQMSGYVCHTYDDDGIKKHASLKSLTEFIANRAQKSEWHREFYFSLPWTIADSDILFQRTGSGFFNADFTNPESIREAAEEGCVVSQKAIAVLAKRRLLGN